jgi:hypothetical protein
VKKNRNYPSIMLLFQRMSSLLTKRDKEDEKKKRGKKQER